MQYRFMLSTYSTDHQPLSNDKRLTFHVPRKNYIQPDFQLTIEFVVHNYLKFNELKIIIEAQKKKSEEKHI